MHMHAHIILALGRKLAWEGCCKCEASIASSRPARAISQVYLRKRKGKENASHMTITLLWDFVLWAHI